MKVLCLQENLNKALSVVSRLVSTKTQLPALGNILIATEKGRLKLSATDLETGISLWLGAKVEKEGGLTLPARVLTELVASLPAGKIDLEAQEEILHLTCEGYKVTLNGSPAKEFPLPPSSPRKPTFSFSPDFFNEAVAQVAFAAAQDEGRPVLTGVKWVRQDKGVFLVATDGYRLSLKKTPLEPESLAGDLIVPARTLLEVAHAAQGERQEKGEEEITMSLLPGENQASFSFKDMEITTRLIEGEFPDFSKIIPSSFTTKVAIEKEVLLKATRVASIFARDSANIVKWKVEKGRLTVSANSPQVGENASEIEVKTEGEEGEIAFNFRFLLDFLGAVGSEEIIFEMSGALNPGVFKPSDDDSYLHIIMPVRVQV